MAPSRCGRGPQFTIRRQASAEPVTSFVSSSFTHVTVSTGTVTPRTRHSRDNTPAWPRITEGRAWCSTVSSALRCSLRAHRVTSNLPRNASHQKFLSSAAKAACSLSLGDRNLWPQPPSEHLSVPYCAPAEAHQAAADASATAADIHNSRDGIFSAS